MCGEMVRDGTQWCAACGERTRPVPPADNSLKPVHYAIIAIGSVAMVVVVPMLAVVAVFIVMIVAMVMHL